MIESRIETSQNIFYNKFIRQRFTTVLYCLFEVSLSSTSPRLHTPCNPFPLPPCTPPSTQFLVFSQHLYVRTHHFQHILEAKEYLHLFNPSVIVLSALGHWKNTRNIVQRCCHGCTYILVTVEPSSRYNCWNLNIKN